MIDVALEAREGGVGFFLAALIRRFPEPAGRVGAAGEVDAVPELHVDPFAGVIEDGDEPPALLVRRVASLVTFSLAGASALGSCRSMRVWLGFMW